MEFSLMAQLVAHVADANKHAQIATDRFCAQLDRLIERLDTAVTVRQELADAIANNRRTPCPQKPYAGSSPF